MEEEVSKQPDVFDPPGGILIWILIFLELLTFGLALIVMASWSTGEADLFHRSRLQLNLVSGSANTLVLLCSGYFMASALQYYKSGNTGQSARFLHFSMLFGWIFIGIKTWEYYSKITEGLTMGSNTFFTFYWLLTGFHFIHVLVGLLIMIFLRRRILRLNDASTLEYFDAGAAFWHMCDLIWLMIFPVLYLFF